MLTTSIQEKWLGLYFLYMAATIKSESFNISTQGVSDKMVLGNHSRNSKPLFNKDYNFWSAGEKIRSPEYSKQKL